MNRKSFLKNAGLAASGLFLGRNAAALSNHLPPKNAPGPFQPTWESLSRFTTPKWFRDAKFGIWAHWGPQCQPEAGDWYARLMYIEGSRQYRYHLAKYGHPSVFGFKDVIHTWKAENWNPEELLALYKKAGAQYFMALANHHDNLDLYNSQHQPWNSVAVGPGKDIIAEWARAARKQGLPFGVSVHAAHAWTWYETAQRYDKTGRFANTPYDGHLNKADGKGKWWEGLDPRELYAQAHPLSKDSWDNDSMGRHWDWGDGAALPSKAYIEKFYLRTIDLIDQYQPDLVYFDDSQLPFWPVSNAGLRIAAHLYNKSIQDKGSLQTVVTGKVLDEEQRKCMVWDIERGQANTIQPLAWQTDTCIGDWHYDRGVYERNGYKSAKTVIQTLVDIVSKNGNLMLNIPVRGDGTIDEKERAIVEEIGQWMAINGESIYATRPWTVFGEGPAMDGSAPLAAQGFNEGKGKAFTAADIRFAIKGQTLYATALGWPQDRTLTIKNLASGNPNSLNIINRIEWLGHGPVEFEHRREGLIVRLPETNPANAYAIALKIN